MRSEMGLFVVTLVLSVVSSVLLVVAVSATCKPQPQTGTPVRAFLHQK
jgi:hypothetical protein